MSKEKLDRVIYSYASNFNEFEEENKLLKETIESLKKELEKFRKPPLLVCEVKEDLGDKALVKLQNGNEFLVEVSGGTKIAPGDSVLAEQKNLTVIKKIPVTKKFNVEKFVIIDKPTVKWDSVGGLKKEANELREVIELPLNKPELFKKIGITPPKGVLLYGPPGTGKTLLAKAVAAATNSTFIEMVGSEMVQKFIGEGAKLVNEVFQLAREKAPAVVFIDEIDALAATRMEVGTSGEREVQRTFMQLLAELDGFKPLGNIKVIGCTNRKDILDPAILRPGRLDRLIKVDVPDEKGVLDIFNIHSKKMKFDRKVNKDLLVKKMIGFSGAEIKAVCTEAGYFAIRADRTKITQKDIEAAIEKVKENKELEGDDYLRMFG